MKLIVQGTPEEISEWQRLQSNKSSVRGEVGDPDTKDDNGGGGGENKVHWKTIIRNTVKPPHKPVTEE